MLSEYKTSEQNKPKPFSTGRRDYCCLLLDSVDFPGGMGLVLGVQGASCNEVALSGWPVLTLTCQVGIFSDQSDERPEASRRLGVQASSHTPGGLDKGHSGQRGMIPPPLFSIPPLLGIPPLNIRPPSPWFSRTFVGETYLWKMFCICQNYTFTHSYIWIMSN